MNEDKKPQDTKNSEAPAAEAPAPVVVVVEEQEARNLGETVPGGRYIVNGVLVNANGEPISE